MGLLDQQTGLLGWREWVSLPGLDIRAIKTKVDTGARSAAIHAYDIEEFEDAGEAWVRFKLLPEQRSAKTIVSAEARLLTQRNIRSSLGHVSQRPVIETALVIGPYTWPIELSLVDRDLMGFRMLLGRQALAQRFLVDPARSYVVGTRPLWLPPRQPRAY